MPIRWIAAAARELNLEPLEAVALLAAKQNYPMNGLLDDDTFLLLKRYSEGHGVESTGARSRADAAVPPPPSAPVPPAPPVSAFTARIPAQTLAAPPPPPVPVQPPILPKGVDSTASTSVTSVTSVTSPIPIQEDDGGGAEMKTVIMPAFPRKD